jgi:hypothetical protein
MSLSAEARKIRAGWPLNRLQSEALQGRHPISGRWWPAWREWRPTGGVMAQILSRFTRITGARAGRTRSPAKTAAARQNGPRGARYGHLGARHGVKGGRPRARKRTEA